MAEQLKRLQSALPSHYRIEGKLVDGGMGSIYLAFDCKHDRKVAIKAFRRDLAATLTPGRFLREIRIMASLVHPLILPLLDSGERKGELFYMMPYLEEPGLRSRIAAEGPLPIATAVAIASDIAAALGYAHSKGIVHCDIKPENILFSGGKPIVADFGIARAVYLATTEVTNHSQAVIGTPAYMSPEQVQGATNLDGRSDLYSLACTLFEMLIGAPPFQGSRDEILRQQVHVEPRWVSAMRPEVPEGIGSVLARALAKEPSKRYATTALFIEELGRAARLSWSSDQMESHIGVINNLPRQLTSFVGRDRELTQCAQLFGETRLLTLTGVGGSGKTRLALKLAERMLHAFPDGVQFLDLAPVSDRESVLQSISSAVDLRQEPGTPLPQVLVRGLGRKRMLILLDTCEHLIESVGIVARELLAGCPSLHLLVTSREGLGIPGEFLFPVGSLSVPDVSATSVDVITSSEAVQLFAQRARAVQTDFAITESNAGVAAELCRRLDGIPLALELAAARVRMLSLEQIREKLEHRFRLLTGGMRALPRHQTLRATFQWSFDLLTAHEQQTLRRLAVFSNGWTLQAATAVVGDNS